MRNTSRGFFRTLITGGVIVVVLLVAAAIVGIDLLKVPFQTTTKDHSPPPILLELRDLADFHAAQAQFEVVIDEEQDVRFMPQAIAGERVQFVAIGTVDAVVDFAGLSDSAVRYDDETNSVIITLPTPTLADPVLDHEQSHVMNRDRGLFNRVGGMFSDNPTSEDDLYLAAADKMAGSAAQTDLVERAQTNTEQMLEGMLRVTGIDSVDVRFYSDAFGNCGSACSFDPPAG